MKTLSLSAKTLFSFLLLGSFMALAGIIRDANFYSASFMNKTIAINYPIEDGRLTASAERELAHAQYIAFNKTNKSSIDGLWEITRVVNEKGEEVYNSNQGKILKLDIEFIGTSLVRIDYDNKLQFEISFLNRSEHVTTMALFRSFGEGYEIIEAKKVESSQKLTKADTTSSKVELQNSLGTSEEKVNTGVIIGDATHFVLERALNPTLDNNTIKGDDNLYGNLVLNSNKEINTLNVTIKGVRLDFEYAPIKEGGVFQAKFEGEQVSGVITNNGKDAYRVRFVTGPFAGALLNFVTEEERDLIREQEEQKAYEQEVAREVQEEVQQERSRIAQEEAYTRQAAPQNEIRELESTNEQQVPQNENDLEYETENYGYQF